MKLRHFTSFDETKVSSINLDHLDFHNKSESIEVLKAFPFDLQGRYSHFQNDKEVASFLVADNGYSLQYVGLELRSDREVVSLALKDDGMALIHAHPSLQANKEVVSIAVAQDGLALQFASKELQADKEVVSIAVQRVGTSIDFASPELKNDKHIALLAVTQDDYAIRFCGPAIHALCKDKDPVKALQASILADELKAEMKPKPKIDNKPKMKI